MCYDMYRLAQVRNYQWSRATSECYNLRRLLRTTTTSLAEIDAATRMRDRERAGRRIRASHRTGRGKNP